MVSHLAACDENRSASVLGSVVRAVRERELRRSISPGTAGGSVTRPYRQIAPSLMWLHPTPDPAFGRETVPS